MIARMQSLIKLIGDAKKIAKRLESIAEERPIDKAAEDQRRWEQITEALKVYRNSEKRRDKYLR